MTRRPSLSPYQLGINEGIDRSCALLRAAATELKRTAPSYTHRRAELVSFLNGIAEDLALGKLTLDPEPPAPAPVDPNTPTPNAPAQAVEVAA